MLNSISKMDSKEGITKYSYPKKENTHIQKLTTVYEKVGSTSLVSATSEKALDEVIKRANKAVALTNTMLEFSVYKNSHEMVVRVKDKETGEVIKQIPSEEMLELGDYLRKLSGIIVDEKL